MAQGRRLLHPKGTDVVAQRAEGRGEGRRKGGGGGEKGGEKRKGESRQGENNTAAVCALDLPLLCLCV
jgi:hypothetical protein